MRSSRIIFFTWLAWAIIVIVFQAWADARVDVKFPDDAVSWTARETGPGYQQGQKYLLEPFMNHQVAWDSEYYLAIAVGGYDDPSTDLIGPPGHPLTTSYAFLPFVPFLMRLFMIPLSVFGMNPIATATLAGVIVSALGALGGMFALYSLTKDSLGEEGGLRAAFYLIIFPTAFFLVQVYTEGVFVGLVFGTLAMIQRKQWAFAALLSAAAVLTRAVGVALIIPMLIGWFRSGDWTDFKTGWKQIILGGLRRDVWVRGLLALTPLLVFLIWKFSFYGLAFDYVEEKFYGSRFMDLPDTFQDWAQALGSLSFASLQRGANYSLIIFLFVLAVVACFTVMKEYPEVAWLSLTIILISWGSGPSSGMHRYVLTTPAIFVALAHWGRNPVFDRAWTLASILWMGLLAALFAMDMWVA